MNHSKLIDHARREIVKNGLRGINSPFLIIPVTVHRGTTIVVRCPVVGGRFEWEFASVHESNDPLLLLGHTCLSDDTSMENAIADMQRYDFQAAYGEKTDHRRVRCAGYTSFTFRDESIPGWECEVPMDSNANLDWNNAKIREISS